MKRTCLLLPAGLIVLVLSWSLFSCDGGNSVINPPGTVAIFVADDLSLFSRVTATITGVTLVNSGMGATCDVMTAPFSVNIADLHDTIQMAAVAQCVPGPYNRLRIEFDRTSQIMSESTGTASACLFTSWRDREQGNQPKALSCAGNSCTLEINGAVNVAASAIVKQVIDFDLRNFTVSGAGTPDCSMSMMVTPLSAAQMHARGYQEAVTGLVSRLSTTNRTFELTRGNRTFSVLYSGVSTTAQPGIDALLQHTQDERLRTRVTGTEIDLANDSVTATEVSVAAAGTVSDLGMGETFTLTYGPGGSRTMTIDYSSAAVDGLLVEGALVKAGLTGHDSISGSFLAEKVSVWTGPMPEE